MDMDFIIRCDDEIKANTKKKGLWKDWKPTRKEVTQEVVWHVAKLCQHVLNGDTDRMEESSADVANICEKIFTMARSNERKEVYDFYGDFEGYETDWKEE